MKAILGRASVLLCLTVAALGSSAGCGVECGEGTYEQDGVCLATQDVLKCAPGFRAKGDACEPDPDWKKTACNPESTRYNPKTGLCDGTGGPTGCTQQCPPVSGGKICISGQAFDWLSYINSSGDVTSATPITKSDGAVLQLYQLMDFMANPTPKPITGGVTTVYNDQGCFIFKDLTPPFTGMYILAVEDEKKANDKYAFLGNAVFTTATDNITDAAPLGLSSTLLNAWGKKILTDGSFIFWFRNQAGKGLEGLTITMGGQPPPWSTGEVFYFDADPGSSPYFADKATKTTSSGLVGVRKAALKSYSATKKGCTFTPAIIGSFPGRILFGTQKIECN